MPKARGFTLLAVNLNSQLGGSGFDHTFKGVAVCGFPFGGHASFFAQGGTKFCVQVSVLRRFSAISLAVIYFIFNSFRARLKLQTRVSISPRLQSWVID